jgi:gluconolactonase
MKHTLHFLVAVAAIVLATSCASEPSPDSTRTQQEIQTIGSIERIDPAFDTIAPSGAVLEILSEGHEWTEGPEWVPALNAVLFSDIPNNAIYSWTEDDGPSVWLQPAGYTGETPRGGESGSNGLLLDHEGRLLMAQHGDRRIARLNAPLTAPAPEFETLVGDYQGSRFNSPNDLILRSDGVLYFTDPWYGLEQGLDDPAKDLPFQGVYRLDPDGTLTLLIDDLTGPNGVALSPDEQTLYVSSTDSETQPFVRAYDVAPDGSLSNERVFFESWADGMAVDTDGNVYLAGPENGVYVVSPEGRHLGTFRTSERTSNCTFGDDGSTLYITADMYLLRIRLNATGLGF